MCIRPVTIVNLNRGLEHSFIPYIKDTVSARINVPCGVCPECASMRQTDLLERCQLMSLDHDIYFGTLTYQQSALPHSDIYIHKDGSRRWYDYADPRDFRLMIKRIRKSYLDGSVDIKYLCVTEYGGSKHRPHFHYLLFVPRREFLYADTNFVWHKYSPSDRNDFNKINFESVFFAVILKEWRRNLSRSTRYPKWLPLCRYVVGRDGRRTFDFHYVKPLTADGKRSSSVCKYVTKYILKFDTWLVRLKHALYNNLETEDFESLWKLLRPRMLVSLKLGVGPQYREHVREGIEWSKSSPVSKDYSVFFDVETGKTMPLGRYLRHHYQTVNDTLTLIAHQKEKQGLTPWDDTFFASKFATELWNGNRDFLDKTESRYNDVLAYLESCNNSDNQFFIDYG